jgi:hypothetical protein
MAADQLGDDVFDVGLGFDVVEFAGGDERRQNRPVPGSALGTREQTIFSRQSQGPDRNPPAFPCPCVTINLAPLGHLSPQSSRPVRMYDPSGSKSASRVGLSSTTIAALACVTRPRYGPVFHIADDDEIAGRP